MSVTKDTTTDQDPDYVSSTSRDEKQQKIYEEFARNNTARKITAIVEKEFSQEIDTKEKEVLEIQERLHKALKTLHLLRYVIITDFYNRKQCQITQAVETKQLRVHPAIKQLIGKAPKNCLNDATPSTSTDPRFLNGCENLSKSQCVKPEDNGLEIGTSIKLIKESSFKSQQIKRSLENDGTQPKKVPRYVPPKSGVPDFPCPSRGVRHKVRKRIVVGNISKWIPPDWREDAASHKWTMYVRGSKEDADIGNFVNKVRFFLHPSYRPNDVVEVTAAPFHLSRRGWGEFPLRVQLHFKSILNKPMDIIHHLKLDRTYTGLQTLGSETLVDVWIYTTELRALEQQKHESSSMSIVCSNTSDVNTAVSDKTGKSQELNRTFNKAIVLPSVEENSNGVKIKEEKPDEEMCDMNSVPNDTNIATAFDASAIKEEIKHDIEILPYTEEHLEFEQNRSLNIEQIREYVHLDHDYLKNHNCIQLTEETNITIDHSFESEHVPFSNPSCNISNTETKNTIHNSNSNIGSQISTTNMHVADNMENNISSKDKSKSLQIFPQNLPMPNLSELSSSSLESNLKVKTNLSKSGPLYSPTKTQDSLISFDRSRNCLKMTSLLSSQKHDKGLINDFSHNTELQNPKISDALRANLLPLKITIPPSFEPSKRVLVLKNNKLFPVDVSHATTKKAESISAKDTSTSAIDNTKTSLKNITCAKLSRITVSHGVSVLKKSQNCNTKINKTMECASHGIISMLKIKPSTSVLLNMNCEIPALEIVDNTMSSTISGSSTRSLLSRGQSLLKEHPKVLKLDEQEEKVPKTKITVGKDKYKIQSKKDLYDDILKSIDDVRILDTEGLIRFIIRRLPIVTQYASDPEYKRLHPYTCESEEEFFSFNVGKQRAYEWYRAKGIRRFLQKKIISEDRLWTVREIMIWARLHGYTPLTTSFGMDTTLMSSGAKKLPSSVSSINTSTCTEPIIFQKWLQSCREKAKNRLLTCTYDSEEEDVDVLVTDEHACDVVRQQKENQGINDNYNLHSKVVLVELEEKLLPLHNFVCDSARDIGIRLNIEEIIPGVVHCVAGRMMMRAVECLMEDLVRSSLAKAWERNSRNGSPKNLTLDDVRGAIRSRQEFDIFTNEGLGSRQQLITGD